MGLGYVGLATAVCFANRGYRVYGVEVDKLKSELIQRGKSPIHEQGIESGLRKSVGSGSFSCGTNIKEAVLNSEITFITVGTPSKQTGEIDLSYVELAAREVGSAIKDKNVYHLVVVKSTVTPGTTSGLVRAALETSSRKLYPKEFGLCFNPEFLREGSAIADTMNPDALIIGADDDYSSDKLHSLFAGFYSKKKLPYTLFTETPNAEFVKYSVNTFRATQLSFLNSLANLCEKIPSTDVVEVVKGLSAVTKIDARYLRPGLGYGGSCLPKDLRALTAMFQRYNVKSSLLSSTADVNQRQPLRAVEVAQDFLGDLEGKKISVLGLTFKAGTDDMRESIAIRIVEELTNLHARTSVYDPKGMESAKRVLPVSVDYAEDARACIKGAHCCIIATEWPEFRGIPASIFKREMQNPLVIDGRRIIDADAYRRDGVFVYEIGEHFPEHLLPRRLSPIISTEESR